MDQVDSDRTYRERYSEIAQLAGGLAHEIRNPLSTMGLNLDLLAEEFPRAEDRREQRIVQKIERIRKEAKRLENILDDFLRFVRAKELNIEPTDLGSVVDRLRDFCEPQAVAQGVVFRTHAAPDLPPVPLDVDLFEQALLNLILNALKAMPNGGELIIRTARDGEFAVLDVIDTGPGIPEDLREKVFEAFFSTSKSGSGLGLPTTRRIVEAHGGRISLRSETGRGSQFTVRLPLSGVLANASRN